MILQESINIVQQGFLIINPAPVPAVLGFVFLNPNPYCWADNITMAATRFCDLPWEPYKDQAVVLRKKPQDRARCIES
jgi:hypothetical protein